MNNENSILKEEKRRKKITKTPRIFHLLLIFPCSL